MEVYQVKDQKALRCGYTTGSCATAAAKAATLMLLGEERINEVQFTTPKGILLQLEVGDVACELDYVCCSILKDAGDDPDVTHGMKIYAKVTKSVAGISIEGGIGIGRITKPGLKRSIGQAAINPIPLQMIEKEVKAVCEKQGYLGGLDILIFAPEGEKIAQKTFNPRLGIVGGISILGTTGIVEPMSEAALIDTIKIELNMRYEMGDRYLLLCPGNYGLDFAKEIMGLQIDKALKYSNYLGETLDYIYYLGFEKVIIIGHVGKLIKVAAGVMNTHSKYADARLEVFATYAALYGHPKEVIEAIMSSVTTEEALRILKEQEGFETIMQRIMDKIKDHIDYRVKNKVSIEILMFSQEYGLLGQTKEAEKELKSFQMEDAR